MIVDLYKIREVYILCKLEMSLPNFYLWKKSTTWYLR